MPGELQLVVELGGGGGGCGSHRAGFSAAQSKCKLWSLASVWARIRKKTRRCERSGSDSGVGLPCVFMNRLLN